LKVNGMKMAKNGWGVTRAEEGKRKTGNPVLTN